jgi:hypothetical protein
LVSEGRCERVPADRYLVSTLRGAFVGLCGLRCDAPNLCAYCARLAARENAKALELDAGRGPAPEVWAVLTTAEPTLDMKMFWKAREQVVRALRRRWPSEYACLLEYTTGYGPRSGGLRRPHWNLLFKGFGAGELGPAAELIRRIWCERTGGDPHAQHIGAVHEAGGLSRYLALHFMKESQKPPEGFRGYRFITSRGYFNGGLTRKQGRELAQEALVADSIRRDGKLAGLRGRALDGYVAAGLERRAELDWTAIVFRTDRWGERTVNVVGGEPLRINRAA